MEHVMAKGKRVFELTHPTTAGIDIGAASHFVAVPPDRDDEPVREFASFTQDLHRRVDRLRGGYSGDAVHGGVGDPLV